MSDAKFTPGPWRVISSLVHVVSTEDHPTVICLTGFAGKEGDESREQLDRWEADARLIAAAPCLYEALEELMEAGEDAWDYERPCLRIAREALAKSRGEQP